MKDLKRRAPAQGQARPVLLVAALAGLFAAVGLLHASTRVAVVKSGYELSRVERTYRALQREQEHLQMERATLRSAARLETIARDRLGMVRPSAAQLIAVRPAKAPAARAAMAALARPARTATP